MTHVCIVGVGLIGGSLGMALRRAKKSGRRTYLVSGVGRTKSKLNLAKKRGAIDIAGPVVKALSGADIVVICVPVHRIVPFVRKNIRSFKRGAIITDVGSAKKSVVDGVGKALRKRPDLSFVGGHPIAGSEKTGVENAKPDLFRRAVCVLIKDGASFRSLDGVRSLWRAVGARCYLLSAAEHDRWLALTSHLPHLLAFSLFSRVENASKTAPILKSLVAGSFHDMTRIAGSDPDLWTGVIAANRREIRRALPFFEKELRFFATASAKHVRAHLKHIARAKKSW